MESIGLREVAAPIMRELADKTGETVLLTEYHAREVVCIEKIEASHSVRLALRVGAVRFPHAGASSKVLMAYLPDAEVRAIIYEKELPRLCERTITDPDELLTEIARIRERGYADSYEGTDVGAWGIATPIWGWRGEVVAALGIVGLTVRYSQPQVEEYVRLCCEAVGRISTLLGARGLAGARDLRRRSRTPADRAPEALNLPSSIIARELLNLGGIILMADLKGKDILDGAQFTDSELEAHPGGGR